MNEKDKSIVFLSYLQSDYSRSGVYYYGLDDEISSYVNIRRSLFSTIIDLWLLRKSTNLSNKKIVVMSPSHKITFFARLVLGKEIILDAGWALSDASIGSKKAKCIVIKKVKNYVVDFISFHSAKKILLESPQEINYVSDKFHVSRNKLKCVYTGFNEAKIKNFAHKKEVADNKRLKVLFRGKINQEAGISNILEATLLLENQSIDFIIATNRSLKEYTYSTNTKVISDFLTHEEIVDLYLSSDVCLGQFSQHSRLGRTIPHKAFESLYFSKCYLTPKTKALATLCDRENQMFFTNSAAPKDLAESLILLEKNRAMVREIGSDGHSLYQKKLRQAYLANLVKTICFEESD